MAPETSEISFICTSIREYRKHGRYPQAHVYVSSLDPAIRKIPALAIEIASFYLVQGHYIRAWEACQLSDSFIFVDGDPSNAFTSQIFDVDHACLAIISAYISISRYGLISTASRIAERVWEIWLAPNPTEIPGPLKHMITSRMENRYVENVIHPWHVLSRVAYEEEHEVWKEEKCITKTRILLEFYCHKIRVTCAEQGLLDVAKIKPETANRMDHLAKWCLAHSRLYEARFLTYFRIDLLNDPAGDQVVLKNLLNELSGKNLTCEEANTHLDIARCIIKLDGGQLTDRASEHVKAAGELFSKAGHEFGILDLMDMQITETQSSKRLEDVLSWKLDTAEVYFTKQCYQQGIRCLMFHIPVSAEMGTIRTRGQSIIERVQGEIYKVGGVLLEQALFVSTVAQSLIRAPEYGYARQCLEDYVKRLPDEVGPVIENALYGSLRGVYMSLNDFPKASLWAEKALLACQKGQSSVDISDAAWALAVVWFQQAKETRTGSDVALIRYSNAGNMLQGWAEIDRCTGYHIGEVAKCLMVARTRGFMQLWASADHWLDRAQSCAKLHGVPFDDGTDLLISRAIRRNSLDEAVDLALNTLAVRKASLNASNFELGTESMRTASTLNMRYIHRLQIEAKKPDPQFEPAYQDLKDACKLASQALDFFKTGGGTELVIIAINYLYDLVNCLPESVRPSLMEAFLGEAEITEEMCDSIRRSSLSTQRVESLFEKRGIVSYSGLQKLYSNTVEASLNVGNSSQAWLWLQRGKARALSDIFGLRALIPERLLAAIRADSEAQALLERERESNNAISTASLQDHVAARRKAEVDRVAMRQHPVLAQLLDLREGRFNVQFDGDELHSVLGVSGKKSPSVKYVDWYIPPNPKAANPNIVLLVRDLAGYTRHKTVAITHEEVVDWTKRIFNTPLEAEHPLRRDNANSKLRELSPLIQDLEQFTDEEDLLIISPTGPLAQIPIHALRFNRPNRALIERNPVLYSSSAAMFRQCQMRSAAEASKIHLASEKPVLFTVYEEDSEAGISERDMIYDHAEKLKESFSFEVLKGNSVIKSAFKEHCLESRFVHYHGHATFDKTDILESRLVFSSEPRSHHVEAAQTTSEDLTVAEAFAMDFTTNCPHFTVIACDSATQDIAPGDEPLGFIPALLFAGATSVLGTLWPVDSRTARIFSEAFYKNLSSQLREQSGQSDPCVLDLAAALRSTIRQLMDRNSVETRQPIHWAPYILYGSWFHVMGT